MKLLFLCLSIIYMYSSFAQNSLTILLKDASSDEALPGATASIPDLNLGEATNQEGLLTFNNVPDGQYAIIFSYVGYESRTDTLTFPFEGDQPFLVLLNPGEELEAIHISATRSSRTIEDIPTRMEAITSEELVEKSVMNSGNISMILRESTGIMVQQTSANSGNQSLRIQGLDGRYTQLLKDGFPLFSGFSSGLSIMQIPPLDLKQVEVIKGSASTLYGGGAIAGLINLVSKEPEAGKPDRLLMLNQTTAKGSNINAFFSQKTGKTGYTVYASGTRQETYDPNKDHFSDIPKVRSMSINPKFYWYPNEKTKMWLGINSSIENRVGGDLFAIRGQIDSIHSFSEENNSKRASSQLHIQHNPAKDRQITFRNSISYFNRSIRVPDYLFRGHQISTYSELNWASSYKDSDWIAGLNLVTEDFYEDSVQSSIQARDYHYLTWGSFVQNNYDFSKKLILESGFRLDYNRSFGFFPLPRLSLLFKPDKKITSRIGGGMGYKLPSIFTEDSEVMAFKDIHPLTPSAMKAEKSIGANFDINYKRFLGRKMTISFNQLFFITRLNNSLVLEPEVNGNGFSFNNADGPVESKGFESNLKITRGPFKLFLQYAFTDVKLKYNNINKQKPLTPKHTAGAVFMYEEEDKWRIGYELYYTGPQFRSDYSKTTDYWIMGFMILRKFEKISLFLNFENFTDTRQSRYQSMITPPHTNPGFTEIWAPTDGFVANGGFIINF